MLESLQRVYDKIGIIHERIEKIYSYGKIEPLNSIKQKYKSPTQAELNRGEKSFSEILAEIQSEREVTQNKSENNSLLNSSLVNEVVGDKDEMQQLLQGIAQYQTQKSASTDLDAIIKEASSLFGVEEALIKAVIRQESQFNPNAVSKSGAQGLMQLMPQTAKLLGVTDPFDITQNVFGGARYLSMLLKKYDGNLVKVLAAYNAGTHRVDAVDGVPNIDETQNYVNQVLSYYYDLKKL